MPLSTLAVVSCTSGVGNHNLIHFNPHEGGFSPKEAARDEGLGLGVLKAEL